MIFYWLWILLPTILFAQSAAPTEKDPCACIAVLKPLNTVDFQAGDSWAWSGCSVTFGERNRWFVYATVGRSAASLDNAAKASEAALSTGVAPVAKMSVEGPGPVDQK